MRWSDKAREELERWCALTRDALAREATEGAELDPEEVLEDLRNHVQEELAAGGASVVTAEDVRRVLERMGPAAQTAAAATPAQRTTWPAQPPTWEDLGPPPSASTRTSTGTSTVWITLLGIALPLAALSIELATGACSKLLLDPLPTPWHVLACALVPLACWLYRSPRTRGARSLPLLLGAAIGVSGYYALAFLPIAPAGILGVIFFGVGLLILAPHLSLVALFSALRRLRRAAREAGEPAPRGALAGVVLGLVALVLANGSSTWTSFAMRWATAGSPQERARGLAILRAHADEERILLACYGRRAAAADPLSMLVDLRERIDPRAAQELYYRVTGATFTSVPAPTSRFDETRWEWRARGGDDVATRIEGLELVSSRIDGRIDADAATAYTEWTLRLRNETLWQQEARALVRLPRDGVVSRVTLWVDGEEREAAFASRAQTSQAYQRVVQRRLDPLLVRTAGTDHVLLQCFPVPPDGGEMQVRIGISAPLALTDLDAAWLRMPAIVERNFDVPASLRHAVWIDSQGSLSTTAPGLACESGARSVARGEVDDATLVDPACVVRARREPAVRDAWSAGGAARQPADALVVQTIDAVRLPPPARIALVVDASSSTAAARDEIAEVLAALAPQPRVRVWLAEPTPRTLGAPNEPGLTAHAAAQLRATRFAGGADAVPALAQAWDWASGEDEAQNGASGVVVWVHGTQPIEIAPLDGLRQRLERDRRSTALVALPASSGPNVVARELGGERGFEEAVRTGSLGSDLARVLRERLSESTRCVVARAREVPEERPPAGETVTSREIARLWARDEVERLVAQRRYDEATELAATYQIVTVASGAVVLENEAQYAEAGLEPVDPTTVPSVPEPELVVLVLLALGALAWTAWRRRREAVAS